MLKNRFWLVLFSLLRAQAVKVLTARNFENFVDSADRVLVVFHSPKCVHCTRLLPVLPDVEKAGIPVGTLDVTTNEFLRKTFQIVSFPTLKVFVDGDLHHDCNEARTPQEIVDCVEPPIDPNSVKYVNERRELLRLVRDFGNGFLLIDFETDPPEEYTALADANPDVFFARTRNSNLLSAILPTNEPRPTAPLLIAVQKDAIIPPIHPPFDSRAIKAYVLPNLKPSVYRLDFKQFFDIKTNDPRPLVAAILDPTAADFRDRLESFRDVALEHADDWVFGWMDGVNRMQAALRPFGISSPPRAIVFAPGEELTFFADPIDLTLDDLPKGLARVRKGEIKPQLPEFPRFHVRLWRSARNQIWAAREYLTSSVSNFIHFVGVAGSILISVAVVLYIMFWGPRPDYTEDRQTATGAGEGEEKKEGEGEEKEATLKKEE